MQCCIPLAGVANRFPPLQTHRHTPTSPGAWQTFIEAAWFLVSRSLSISNFLIVSLRVPHGQTRTREACRCQCRWGDTFSHESPTHPLPQYYIASLQHRLETDAFPVENVVARLDHREPLTLVVALKVVKVTLVALWAGGVNGWEEGGEEVSEATRKRIIRNGREPPRARSYPTRKVGGHKEALGVASATNAFRPHSASTRRFSACARSTSASLMTFSLACAHPRLCQGWWSCSLKWHLLPFQRKPPPPLPLRLILSQASRPFPRAAASRRQCGAYQPRIARDGSS